MARPSLPSIDPGTPGWDALVNDIIDAIHRRPFPPLEEPDLATLTANFPPASHDRCLATTADTSTLYISNGTTWVAV